MKLFECKDAPIRVFGLMNFYKNGSMMSLPEESLW